MLVSSFRAGMHTETFGAFTGGLNIRSLAFMNVFGALSFRAHMLGATRLYAVDAVRCLPD